jgi:hypothetical protein
MCLTLILDITASMHHAGILCGPWNSFVVNLNGCSTFALAPISSLPECG